MVSFREAGAGDVPPLVALINSAYRGDTSRQGWTTEADILEGTRVSAASLAAMMAPEHTAVHVAHDDDGHLAGCYLLRLPAARGGDAYVGTITVNPARQGGGWGSALLADAEQRARGAGAAGMEMWVISVREELIAFYRRRGYADTGRRAPFPTDDPSAGQPLREDLEFMVLRKPLA